MLLISYPYNNLLVSLLKYSNPYNPLNLIPIYNNIRIRVYS